MFWSLVRTRNRKAQLAQWISSFTFLLKENYSGQRMLQYGNKKPLSQELIIGCTQLY